MFNHTHEDLKYLGINNNGTLPKQSDLNSELPVGAIFPMDISLCCGYLSSTTDFPDNRYVYITRKTNIFLL